MSVRRSAYVRSGTHELHVSEWGDRARPLLVMWHGLARTGRDFDEAAAALSDDYFVVCPDTLGRGLSSWATDAAVDYSYATFGTHALAILDHYGADTLRWVGTSMGGLIGVTLAAGRLKGRMTHLVVNDIGPAIPESATGRIASYVGNPPVFDTMAELETWLRTNYAPFGDNADAFWRRMADTSARRTDSGKVTVHYDPQIVTQFTLHKGDLDCWPQWDGVAAKTLLLRGETSDVLPAAVATEMTGRGPRPELVEFAGVGHAPTLATEGEIATLRAFLRG
ncbi:MAG: alpha/beta hydrolase [Notoacmeibacter sp.]|nr:alpha/beta hydrolase [Notoacmeibacter sp.]MCC0031676.1 alpha/beta hydrolase [Brucellaceae bacterium]